MFLPRVPREPRAATLTPSRPRSRPVPKFKAPKAAAAEGLSKLTAVLEACPRVALVAGDFLTCCGDDRGPWGEKAACAAENGVETGGVPTAPGWDCDGVLPCCDKACFMGVEVSHICIHFFWLLCFLDGSWVETPKQPVNKLKTSWVLTPPGREGRASPK